MRFEPKELVRINQRLENEIVKIELLKRVKYGDSFLNRIFKELKSLFAKKI